MHQILTNIRVAKQVADLQTSHDIRLTFRGVAVVVTTVSMARCDVHLDAGGFVDYGGPTAAYPRRPVNQLLLELAFQKLLFIGSFDAVQLLRWRCGEVMSICIAVMFIDTVK